jgi:hypothetical protein
LFGALCPAWSGARHGSKAYRSDAFTCWSVSQ